MTPYMKKLHDLHCKDDVGTADIKNVNKKNATLARPTYSRFM